MELDVLLLFSESEFNREKFLVYKRFLLGRFDFAYFSIDLIRYCEFIAFLSNPDISIDSKNLEYLSTVFYLSDTVKILWPVMS